METGNTIKPLKMYKVKRTILEVSYIEAETREDAIIELDRDGLINSSNVVKVTAALWK